ncbi:MAG: adenylate/guanylate cyclase domain-containing protein, partial [Myxococcales bacterium]
FGVFFAAALLVRRPLEQRLIDRAPLATQARRQFVFDLALFVAVGVAITTFDRLVYGFPVGSGLKALLGAATIGVFYAADSALARERQVLRRVEQHGEAVAVSSRPFSMTRRFAVVALSILGLMAVDLAFLSLRNLQQLADADSATLVSYQRELLGESAIALAFFLPLTINLILSFARNLRMFLDYQQRALDEVSKGQLDVRVPVASADEFGVIAEHTNRMIDGLREREQIRDAFGKLVSPGIARRLLGGDGIKLGGSRRRVVVLFSDVRNFTTRTETADPETLVADLNLYFTRMVEIVHRYGGVVDKFIGDGMMAIFGLEQFEQGADQGVRAAVAMLTAVDELNQRGLSSPIAIGIGLHAGEVVAGTIGSTARLEFTFIGDTVNVAARIEGL